MAWIEKRQGSWVVRHRDGLSKIYSDRFGTKVSAERELRRVSRLEAAREPVRRGSTYTLLQLIERYKKSRISRGNDELNTIMTADRLVKMIDREGWTAIEDLTPGAIEAWREKGHSERDGASLRAVLRHASEVMSQPVNARILVLLRPNRVRRRPRPALVADDRLGEAQRLADGISQDVGAVIHCLLTYGWRPITAARLKVGDVDLRSGEITTLVKGGDVVRHPLRADTLERLREVIGDRPASDPLFRDPRDKDGHGWSAKGELPAYIGKHLGLKSYDLKRACISSMLQKNMDVATIQLFTGHRTPSQVLRYARSNDERARAALDMVGFSPAKIGGRRGQEDRI